MFFFERLTAITRIKTHGIAKRKTVDMFLYRFLFLFVRSTVGIGIGSEVQSEQTGIYMNREVIHWTGRQWTSRHECSGKTRWPKTLWSFFIYNIHKTWHRCSDMKTDMKQQCRSKKIISGKTNIGGQSHDWMLCNDCVIRLEVENMRGERRQYLWGKEENANDNS